MITNQFVDLKVSKTALYDFMRDKYRISLKKAHFHSVNRNSPESLEKRYDWVIRQHQTDIGYLSNCAIVDDAAFHIDMKRTVA